MLISDSPITLTDTTLPRLRHSAGVAGYTHRYIADEVTAAVDAVTLSLPDYVGGKNLTVAANGPTVKALADGRKYLQFDGTNDTLSNTTITTGDCKTVVFIARARTTDGVTTILGSGSSVLLLRSGTSGTTMNNDTSLTNTTKLDNQWRVVTCVADGTNFTLQVDGVTVTAANAGIFGTALRLAANGTPASFSPLDCLEVITYSTALDSTQRADVRTAMLAAYPVELLAA